MQLFISIAGILLSAILLWFNARNNRSAVYLGVFFILASISSFHRYVVNFSGSVTLVGIFLVNFSFVYYIVGQSLYLYIRSILTDDPRLKKQDLWHLLPVVFFLITGAPYLFTSWEFKKEVAESFIRIETEKTRYLAEIFGSSLWLKVFVITPILIMLVYVFKSAVMLFVYLKQKKERQVFIQQQYAVTWIKTFMGVILILIFSYLFISVYTFVLEHAGFYSIYKKLDTLLATGPFIVLILTFFSPRLLYGLPRVPAPRAEVQIPGGKAFSSITAGKTSQKKLESGYLQAIGNEADVCMEKFQPYTNPGFNLAELSVLIHIPEHHLAYYFREERKQSFTDYRNEWRVKHAKKLIEEGKTSEITLEAIGLLSGFSSRNTFYRVFKDLLGVSPGKFADINQKES